MGVSFLIGGVHKEEPMLFETDVGGDIYGWNAQVIGKGRDGAREILEDEWEEDISKKEAKKLAVKCLSQGEVDMTKNTVRMAIIDSDGFRYAEDGELKDLL